MASDPRHGRAEVGRQGQTRATGMHRRPWHLSWKTKLRRHGRLDSKKEPHRSGRSARRIRDSKAPRHRARPDLRVRAGATAASST